MSNVKECMDKMMQTDGCIGCCVVDSTSGMMMGEAGGANFNLEVAAATNTQVVRAKRDAIRSLELNDSIEDILITLAKQYHLIRPLTANPNVFIYVALDRAKSNLALARHALAKIESELVLN